MANETKVSARVALARAKQLAKHGDKDEQRWGQARLRERTVRLARRGARLGFYDHETYEDLLSEDWDD